MKLNFKNLIPPLTEQEYQLLETCILAEGCREPLIVWNSIIVDGHNRYGICQKHNLPYQTVEKKFDSKEEAEIWILSNQLGRRNLTDDQRAIITDELIEKQSTINKIKRAETARKGKDKSISDTVSDIDKQDTRKERMQQILYRHMSL